ncbi:acyltransferase family protein [Halobacillus sp. Marseille-Q1614]|uniref:acyltransferase family protein n=1 Tax=Halobacillus sp. Marseille-Q1614 TaxID=2709134 RepID=UPI0015704EED|nr:acyltransferase family protein [Halobacillus sp. Marseille-Q1614]
MVKEWNYLRVLACLSIVFLHSTTHIGRQLGLPDYDLYALARVLLCYATPTFIVLSEIILANRYPDKLPEGFFKKRFKFIILPFISFSIIDALVKKYMDPNIILSDKVVDNMLFGQFEGYFILIILQFYILHYIVVTFNISMKTLLPVSLFIMCIHLMAFNANFQFLQDYTKHHKLLFTAWFGYFTAAFIIGKYYKEILSFLTKNIWLPILCVFLSIAIIYINFQSGETGVHSRRIDLFAFTIFITLSILSLKRYFMDSTIINLISNYSLGIYLVHWQVQRLIAPYVGDFFGSNSTGVIGLFLISLLLTMFIIKLISLIPLGSFVVGNTKRRGYQKKKKAVSVAS